jgi:23S rRNA pseudouridine1911/1915/1917 synthase
MLCGRFKSHMLNNMNPQRHRQFRVGKSRDGQALVGFLAASLGISNKKAKVLLDRRSVFVNNRRTWMARHILSSGDIVEVLEAEGSKVSRRVHVLFRDSHYVIADKPPGILTCGENSLEYLLRRDLGARRLTAAHRLDRDTSGCVVFAVTPEARDLIVTLFRKRAVRKIYNAIVEGRFRQARRTVSVSISGATALTHVEAIDTSDDASHVRVRIETGRTHQIRRHLSSIGHPVAGDRQYGLGRKDSPLLRSIPRQMLHASRLEFMHPFTERRVSVSSPLPPDYVECLSRFRLHRNSPGRR